MDSLLGSLIKDLLAPAPVKRKAGCSEPSRYLEAIPAYLKGRGPVAYLQIQKDLGIDRGHLSRIMRRLVEAKVVVRLAPVTDRRKEPVRYVLREEYCTAMDHA